MPRVKKAARDPNKPKKALSAYFFFSNSKRSEVTGSVTEKAKKLGEMWKGLSEKDRQPFVKMADDDKVRYAKAMEGYVPPVVEEPAVAEEGEVAVEEGAEVQAEVAKKVKKERKPRKPTGYNLFGKAERVTIKQEHPDMKQPDVMRAVAAAWNALTDDQKAEWNTKANA